MERFGRCNGERGATDVDPGPGHQSERGMINPFRNFRCSLHEFVAEKKARSKNPCCPKPQSKPSSPLVENDLKKKTSRMQHTRKRRSSSSFIPSSFVRITVDGEKRIVSSYFPLPPNASQPEVIDRREMKRILSKTRNQKQQPLPPKQKKTASDKEEEEEPKITKKKKKKQEERKQRSLLSPQEKKLDAYRRVGEESVWEAPKSEFNLLQERHCFDPWRVLVICMLLNMTTGLQVKRVLPGLFLRCPNAEAATKIPEEELAEVIKPLGLYRKRAKDIIRLSCEYLGSEWTHVTQLPGVGKYAADAYAIFCAGKPEEVIPEDHKLVDYWKFVCEKRAQELHQFTFESTEVESDDGFFLP